MDLKGKHYITIRVKGYGDIKIELDESVAPITVNNFIKLVNQKFYDGLTCLCIYIREIYWIIYML